MAKSTPSPRPPSRRRTKPIRKVGFRLSLGSLYYSEDWFLEVLAPFSLSRFAFRAWCRAMGVPLIYIGPHVVINVRKFEIALEAVSHIGNPDFLVPGALDHLSRHRPVNSTSRLDPDFVAANYRTFVAELLSSYLRPGRKPSEVLTLAYETARQWALHEIIHRPQEAQSLFSAEAVALLNRRLPLNTDPPDRFASFRIRNPPSSPPISDPDADSPPAPE